MVTPLLYPLEFSSLAYCSPKLEGRLDLRTGERGVFAREKLEPQEVLCVWGGQILTDEQVLALPLEKRRLLLQVEDGLYQYSFLEGEADWINHSCEPNAGISGQTVLVAMRRILPGEEVCFDYAMTENNTFPHTEFDCYCNTPSCRGRFTGQDWKNPDLWEKYEGYFSSYLQRKIARLRLNQRYQSA
jgi:SET domain-containing protein